MQKLFLFLFWALSASMGFAETKIYQTPLNPSTDSTVESNLNTPVISVNPDTGGVRVFITPDGSFSNQLVSHGAPVYHARAVYDPSQSGIPASLINLHRQMAYTCPQGWIKLQEWASLQTDPAQLHYQFQCLEAN